MAAQDCPKCSAPLPLGEIGSVATCPYCHTQSRILDPRADVPPSANAPGPAPFLQGQVIARPDVDVVAMRAAMADARQKQSRLGVFMAIGIVGTIVVVFVVALIATTGSSRGGGSGVTAAIAGPTRMSLSALATYDESRWTPFDPTGMVGTFASFDVIANAPWALGVARRWSPDARIATIYVDGLRADGMIDVSASDDWYVDYRFFSPARRAAAARMREVSEATVNTEFRVQVKEGEATAYVTDTNYPDDVPPDHVPTCPLVRVLDTWRATLPPRPTYGVMMIHHTELDRGWAWSLNMSGVSVTPSLVSADSCAGLP